MSARLQLSKDGTKLTRKSQREKNISRHGSWYLIQKGHLKKSPDWKRKSSFFGFKLLIFRGVPATIHCQYIRVAFLKIRKKIIIPTEIAMEIPHARLSTLPSAPGRPNKSSPRIASIMLLVESTTRSTHELIIQILHAAHVGPRCQHSNSLPRLDMWGAIPVLRYLSKPKKSRLCWKFRRASVINSNEGGQRIAAWAQLSFAKTRSYDLHIYHLVHTKGKRSPYTRQCPSFFAPPCFLLLPTFSTALLPSHYQATLGTAVANNALFCSSSTWHHHFGWGRVRSL